MEKIASQLVKAREETLQLLSFLPDQLLRVQHNPLMSPLIWDLGHIANFEDQWLLGALGHPRVASPSLDALYNPTLHPRSTRATLALPATPDILAYASTVRERTLEGLDDRVAGRLSGTSPATLLENAYVYGMALQHEHQHRETLLATLQLMEVASPLLPVQAPVQHAGGEIEIPEGVYQVGNRSDPWAYDNERPPHPVQLDGFWIDRCSTSQGEFLEFIKDNGYRRENLWHPLGWSECQASGLGAPLFWSLGTQGWHQRSFSEVQPLVPEKPVQHISWYEADAYARWKGKRLPTEFEWEVAADRGASGEEMLGNVWEWTDSNFLPYPGFKAFPYRDYSEAFFGPDYKVLRGGSWATANRLRRTSFRNWDYPIRRQIFAGFRCARNA